MKIVYAAHGDTWDSIARKYLNDEFLFSYLHRANARHYSDVLVFDGGEKLVIPEDIVQQTTIIKAPWEE